MFIRKSKGTLLPLLLILIGAPISAISLRAHDFWLTPSNYTPNVGELVEIFAMIGHGNEAEAFERNHDHIKRLIVQDAQGIRTTQGVNFRLPTGSFKVRTKGTQIVGYESHEQTSVLPENRFDKYLKEEGLESILIGRKAEEEDSRKEVKEGYTRCAKSVLFTQGEKFSDQWLGLPLEIKLLSNPLELSGHQSMILQVHYDGSPLEGALVKGYCLANEDSTQALRTDGNGFSTFQCSSSGRWMFNVVHMLPSSGDTSLDWHSYWASLTIEIPSRSVINNRVAQR